MAATGRAGLCKWSIADRLIIALTAPQETLAGQTAGLLLITRKV